jgi:hypothetical protein
MAPLYEFAESEPLSAARPVTAIDGCMIVIAGIRLDLYSVKRCAARNMPIENAAATDALAS